MSLQITREARFAYCARWFTVEIDGKPAETLRNGDTAQVVLAPGVHSVSFLIGGKTHALVSVTVSGEEVIQIVCWANASGGIDVHSASPSVQKQFDASGKSVLGTAAGILVSILLFFVLIRLAFWLAILF